MLKNRTEKSERPVVLVTYVNPSASEISSLLGMDLEFVKIQDPSQEVAPFSGKRYVYGIKGIQELFSVSHATAQKYKDGILKEAVYQSGRKIVVDVEKALELFNSRSGR